LEKSNHDLTTFLAPYDLDLVGVADLADYHQQVIALDQKILNGYPYAVCLGLAVSKGILDTVTEGPNLLYLHHYRQVNYRLDMIAYLLSREIERRGYQALPFAASQVVDWRNQKAHVSHKRIGEIAGMGWIGRNNLLVHPDLGARVRYNTVLTDMPLQPSVQTLTADCGSCAACIRACPAGAIGEDASRFDHRKCYDKLTEFRNQRNLGHHICGICVEACKGSI
jgi:epoxyqueuosine reductase